MACVSQVLLTVTTDATYNRLLARLY